MLVSVGCRGGGVTPGGEAFAEAVFQRCADWPEGSDSILRRRAIVGRSAGFLARHALMTSLRGPVREPRSGGSVAMR